MLAADDPEVLHAVLDSLPMGVYVVDRHGKILLWNSAAERITGHLRQSLMGQAAQEGFLSYIDSEDNVLDAQHAPLSMAIRDGQSGGTVVNLRHKLGHRVPVRLFASPIRNSFGSVIGAVECFDEADTAAKWVERHGNLSEYGGVDDATGVLSHAMIELRLRESLAEFGEKPVPFSIACIAIDNLERTKRRDGPAVLAPILRVFGLTLESSLRPTDFVGRWGENEFLAILTDCSAEGITASGERLRRMLSQAEIDWWGDSLKLTASLGCTTVMLGDDTEALLARAEKALKESAARGDSVTVLTS